MTVTQWVNTIYLKIKEYQHERYRLYDVDDDYRGVGGDKSCSKVDGSICNVKDIENHLSSNDHRTIYDSSKTSTLSIDDNSDDITLTTDHLYLLAQHLYECELNVNEVLYFPSMWMHATLNMDEYNVFMSVFIDTQLIK